MDNDNNLSLDERIASELLVTKDMTIEQLRELIQLVVVFLLEPASSNFQDGLSSYVDKYKINAGILKNIVRSLIGNKTSYNVILLLIKITNTLQYLKLFYKEL